MRVALLASVLLLAPLTAGALPTTDARHVVANQVYPTGCPSYTTPAAIGCFDAPAGAAAAHVEVDEAVGAQPLLWVWVYDGRHLLRSFTMCRDGVVDAAGATQLVVALELDRTGCPAPDVGLVAAGTLTVTWQ